MFTKRGSLVTKFLSALCKGGGQHTQLARPVNLFIRPFQGRGTRRKAGGGLAAPGCVSLRKHLSPANGLLFPRWLPPSLFPTISVKFEEKPVLCYTVHTADGRSLPERGGGTMSDYETAMLVLAFLQLLVGILTLLFHK